MNHEFWSVRNALFVIYMFLHTVHILHRMCFGIVFVCDILVSLEAFYTNNNLSRPLLLFKSQKLLSNDRYNRFKLEIIFGGRLKQLFIYPISKMDAASSEIRADAKYKWCMCFVMRLVARNDLILDMLLKLKQVFSVGIKYKTHTTYTRK